jgi:hypothetical protein
MVRIVLGLAFIAISVLVYFLWSEIKKQQVLMRKQRLERRPKRVPVIPPKRSQLPDDLRLLTKKDTGYKRPVWQNTPPTQPTPTKQSGSTPLQGTPPPPERTPPKSSDPVKPVIPDTFNPPHGPFKPPTEQPSAQTSQKLMVLVNGNKRLAERLVSSAKIANPNKSDKWLVEKVIWDLERDRT